MTQCASEIALLAFFCSCTNSTDLSPVQFPWDWLRRWLWAGPYHQRSTSKTLWCLNGDWVPTQSDSKIQERACDQTSGGCSSSKPMLNKHILSCVHICYWHRILEWFIKHTLIFDFAVGFVRNQCTVFSVKHPDILIHLACCEEIICVCVCVARWMFHRENKNRDLRTARSLILELLAVITACEKRKEV